MLSVKCDKNNLIFLFQFSKELFRIFAIFAIYFICISLFIIYYSAYLINSYNSF